MAETVESPAKEAIELPPDQRLTLAQRILASVEPDEKLPAVVTVAGNRWKFQVDKLV
jgi:hypothetical protein